MYSPRLVAFAALLLVFSLSVSCSSWRQIRTAEQHADPGETYDRLRVELVGGTKVVLRHAHITADTLRGKPDERLKYYLREQLKNEGVVILPDKSVDIPVVHIRKMHKREFDAGNTVGSGAAVALLLVGVGLAIFLTHPFQGL